MIKQPLLLAIKYSCLLLTLFITCYANANQGFQFKRISVSQGLPSNNVLKIFEQSSGHIWFATDAGAARYDGENFIYYKQQGEGSRKLSNNFVNDIVEDAQGNLWFATENGLNRLATDGKMTQYFHRANQKNSLSSNWITTLCLDSTGTLWVGTGSGIDKYNKERDNFEPINLIINDQDVRQAIWSIFESPAKELIISSGYRILVYQPVQNEFIEFSPNTSLEDPRTEAEVALADLLQSIDYVHFDQRNNLWLSSGAYGLFKLATKGSLNSANFNRLSWQKSQVISKIQPVEDGKSWLLGTEHLVYYNHNSNKQLAVTKVANDDKTIPANIVADALYDSNRGLWFATGNGVAYLSGNKEAVRLLSSQPSADSIVDEDIYSLAITQGKLWLASENAIETIDPKTHQTTASPSKYASNGAYQISASPNGHVWFALHHGLLHFNPETKAYKFYSNKLDNPNQLPSSVYFTVLADNAGGVWFTGHVGVGLQYFHPETNTRKQYLTENNRYADTGNYSYRTVFDSDNNIWMATTAGVFFFDTKTSEHRQISLEKALKTTRINDIAIDPQGQIWLATNGYGLVKLSLTKNGEQAIEQVTTKFDHANDIVRSIAFDKSGNVWLTSPSAIYRYSPSTDELIILPALTSGIDHFFRDTSSASHQNYIYFGTSSGLVSIDTNLVESQIKELPTFINSVSTNERFIDLSMVKGKYPDLDLGSSERSLTIDFSSLDYTAPQFINYRYKLQGFDDAWQSASADNHAHYGGLNFGNYTFIVQSRNNFGEWTQAERTINISIAKPIWFYLLLISVFAIVMLTYIIYKYRKISIRELRSRANYDSLTGLINRYYFNKILDLRFESQAVNPFAIFFIDMDHFKSINDSYGHSVGDEFIITTARRLARNVKKTDTLCRLSGDEFAIIIDGYHKADELQDIAKRLNSALSIPIQIEQHHIKSSASIGVACYPHDGDDRQKLLTNADIAMYKAKESGRNQTSFYDQKLGSKLAELRYISAQLNNGIENNEFLLHYQPKVCSKTGYVMGFESLVRWQHPERGMIRPDLFINEAEKNGAIIELGYWILKEAMTTASHWDRKGLLKGSVAVNISPVQINHPGLIDKIKALLVETELAPEKLELEITENVFINNLNHAKRVLNEISKLGIKIALDDFGSGFSSLSYLTQLPLNTLKVDKYMVDQLDKTEQASVVLKGIFELGHGLGLQMVAEGVEQVEQLNFIRNFGEPLIQGYFFSKPVDKEHANLLFGKCYYPLTVDGKYLA